MAFHLPGRLGDEKNDEQSMNATNHMAVGVNVGYQYADSIAGNGVKTVSANGVSVPEVEFWPLVGGLFGNFGVWSEIDSSPSTNTGGGIGIKLADVRYAAGTPDLFFNFRAGVIAPEGFGASDQWLDDGNIPLMDVLAANRNQNTMVSPFGAMNSPEEGVEVGANYKSSHLTVGLYNGWTDVTTNADGTLSQATSLQMASLKHNDQGMRDYRIQLDQFVGDVGAITAGYYHGTVPLTLPQNNTTFWLDHFSQARLYLTAFAIPGKLDLFAGGAWGQSEFVSDNPTPDGSFTSKGAFVGANYYVAQHLTLGGRVDRTEFSSDDSATGVSLQASLPYNNTIFIFHYNHSASSLASGPLQAGWNNDIGFVLRFLL